MRKSRLAAPLAAFAAPLLLYGGALVSQYGFGLHPCEMCYWQRWPHQAAILLALIALLLRRNDKAMRALTLLAALAIAVSGAFMIESSVTGPAPPVAQVVMPSQKPYSTPA